MRSDGHCGFRAIAHAICKCQDNWNDIRTSLTNRLESYGKDDANMYVLTSGTKFGEPKNSLECRASEGAPRSQWLHDLWYGKQVTDPYSIFLACAEKVGEPRHWSRHTPDTHQAMQYSKLFSQAIRSSDYYSIGTVRILMLLSSEKQSSLHAPTPLHVPYFHGPSTLPNGLREPGTAPSSASFRSPFTALAHAQVLPALRNYHLL